MYSELIILILLGVARACHRIFRFHELCEDEKAKKVGSALSH